VFCHARLRPPSEAAASGDGPLEVISGDLRIYTPDGTEIDMVAPAAAPNEPGKRLPPVPKLDQHGAAIRAEFAVDI